MALTTRQHRQLARIDADLRRDDPHLANVLAPPTRHSRRALAEVLAPLAVNVSGLVVLVIGALLHQTPMVVTGLFLGAAGPLMSVAAFRVMDLRRARAVSRRAAR
jgi:hypothetical protein